MRRIDAVVNHCSIRQAYTDGLNEVNWINGHDSSDNFDTYVVKGEEIVLLRPAVWVRHRAVLVDLAVRLTTKGVHQTRRAGTSPDRQAGSRLSIKSDIVVEAISYMTGALVGFSSASKSLCAMSQVDETTRGRCSYQ